MRNADTLDLIALSPFLNSQPKCRGYIKFEAEPLFFFLKFLLSTYSVIDNSCINLSFFLRIQTWWNVLLLKEIVAEVPPNDAEENRAMLTMCAHQRMLAQKGSKATGVHENNSSIWDGWPYCSLTFWHSLPFFFFIHFSASPDPPLDLPNQSEEEGNFEDEFKDNRSESDSDAISVGGNVSDGSSESCIKVWGLEVWIIQV